MAVPWGFAIHRGRFFCFVLFPVHQQNGEEPPLFLWLLLEAQVGAPEPR